MATTLPSAGWCIPPAVPTLLPSPTLQSCGGSQALPSPLSHHPFLTSIWITFSPIFFMRTPLLLPTLSVSSHFSLGGPSHFFILIISLSPLPGPRLAEGAGQSLLLLGHGSRWGGWPQLGWAVIPPHPPHSTPGSACTCPASACGSVTDSD